MKIKLNVPYFNQVDNATRFFGNGNRQCCMTANAMSANYLLQTRGLESLIDRTKRLKLREPECAYGEILNIYGDTTDHTANTRALQHFKLESYFSTTLGIKDLIKSLEADIPPAIGLHYKSSGHILTVVGVDTDEKFFWVHDPYGIRAGIADYYEAIGGQSGRYDKYSFKIMRELWESMNDGWGRVFTAINGKPTGL